MAQDIHVEGRVASVKQGAVHGHAFLGMLCQAEGAPSGQFLEETAELAVLAGEIGFDYIVRICVGHEDYVTSRNLGGQLGESVGLQH